MLFQDYHIPQIRSGEKTVTRREWDQRQVVPGRTYIASTELFTSHEDADCYITVTDVYQEQLGAMTDADAQREGAYESLEEFIESYNEIYEGGWDPEKTVWVVEFEYAGRSREVCAEVPK